MKPKFSLILMLLFLSFRMTAQNPACFASPDGTDANSWSYKDYVIPTGYRIDSVMFSATRTGYPTSQYDFIFDYCSGTTTFNQSSAVEPWNYLTDNNSEYNHWINLTSFSYTATGMVRVHLPTNAGAVWGQVCFAISSLCTPDITTGLVARYDFTGNASDLSGNGNNGTVFGATLVSDRFGNPNSAYSFNGTDSIKVPNSASLQFPSNIISVSIWVTYGGFASIGNDNIPLSKQSGSGTTQQGFNIEQGPNADGTTQLLVSNGGGNFGGSTTGAISLSQTKHLVFVYNNGTAITYLNGVSVNTSSSSATIGANTMPMLIGTSNWINPNAFPFNGVLDDIRIYNRALTACDADSLYNMPNPIITGIASEKANTDFSIYPNPASDFLLIRASGGENSPVLTRLFNLAGQILKTEAKVFQGAGNEVKMDVSDLPCGFYILRVGNSARKIQIVR